MKANYYLKTIQKIKNLIGQSDYDQALKLLNQELKMPYIPLEYESDFSNLYLQILELKRAKNLQSPKTLTPQTFIEYLNDQDYDKVMIAIDNIEQINLRLISEELKKWIENEANNYHIIKVIILEQMASQKIDLDINFNDQIINPYKYGSIFENQKIINIFLKIENLTTKEPSLANFAHQNLKTYLLIKYPLKVLNKNLAQNIVQVTRKMLNQKVTLNQAQKDIQKIINSFNL